MAYPEICQGGRGGANSIKHRTSLRKKCSIINYSVLKKLFTNAASSSFCAIFGYCKLNLLNLNGIKTRESSQAS